VATASKSQIIRTLFVNNNVRFFYISQSYANNVINLGEVKAVAQEGVSKGANGTAKALIKYPYFVAVHTLN
jgi:hypothetical protein